ncbi:response regulator transcription factor [Bdellovibrio sp.]|uniref:response regulator transcription factor n=1 Tax=Bdellovibrio sp. TaxID=28201 RepID=UPI0039E5CF0D
MRILLIEDDHLVGDGIQLGLTKQGFTVDWVQNVESAQSALKTDQFDVIVLDIGLPRVSGLEFLKKLRAANNKIPVLLLTAKSSVEDRIQGLDSGADDYLPKPFSLGEVAARLRALQRRSQGRAVATLKWRDLTVFPDSQKVMLKESEIDVRGKELRLLLFLMEHPHNIYSREELESSLYGWNEGIESNSVEVHVHSLRKKLGKEIIKTVRGSGYQLGEE